MDSGGEDNIFLEIPEIKSFVFKRHIVKFIGDFPRNFPLKRRKESLNYISLFAGQPPVDSGGRDNILPAVLEFREDTEDSFFSAITMGLDVNSVQFKLAPTYTIYMATRFRASTHYRPELIPEERAIRLTAMLDSVADCIYGKSTFLVF